MTTPRQWNAQIFPKERRQVEDQGRGPSWWVAKDRAAFREELRRQAPRMAGAKTEKVEGFHEDLRRKRGEP